MVCAAALALTGCGKSASASPAELALQREDLVFVARALQSLEGQTTSEVAATQAAWPSVANGLARRRSGLYTPKVRAAIETAERLQLPTLFDEQQAAELTGQASSIAGLYRAFEELASRGWRMVGSAIYQIEHGSRSSARFSRANAPLYIDSIYDGHFGLAQIGKKLQDAYQKLGGQPAFRVALTQAEVDALAAAYSEERNRLEPHVGVKLGS